MNRISFIVLAILKSNDAFSRTSAMSIKEIVDSEELGCKENTLFKKLKKFQQDGYVDLGLKEGHANTYFLTEQGAAYLEKEKER